ncbi:MAG TPA: sigma-70 family RNA polymerase sigma factor [Candidatus Paceibacterota bacterium]|nr:sigma-70 family RNA polymerase sigma factor [Verrucomicrobiota bacterium]HSA13091.1 sigma-70 family RNA polymerase sigma factor [Candidatus Paceibacterota bacterium]
MQTDAENSDKAHRPRGYFATTHWTVVLGVGDSDTTQTRAALEKLCHTYWYPLYAYVRRYGYSPEDAQDLTQEFFARLLERKWVERADPQQGRFRSFLLGVLKHFLADERDKMRAQKRGGGIPPIPLEVAGAETRYQLELPDNLTAEKIYEKRWALALLENVLTKLRREYEADGKEALFAKLEACLTKGRAAIPYRALAEELHMGEGALRMTVHRLRARYRQLLRSEIADTVLTREEVEEEMRHLFQVLSG